MRIGIDAKWFYDGPPSNKEVVRNLVQSIIEKNTEHELYILLDRRCQHLKFPYNHPKVHAVYVWSNVNLVSNVLVLPAICRRLKLDSILAQNFTPPFAATRVVTFIHDVIFATHPEYFTLVERIYFWPIKGLLKFADSIITVSKSEKERLESKGFGPGQKINVVYHGVAKRFRPRRQFGKPLLREVKERYNLHEPFVLYVGRLNQRKNLANLLESVRHLRNKEALLVLAGKEDWKMFDLHGAIRRLGIESRVRLTGFVPDEDLPPLYSLASLFCYVSFEEGFGMPPLEAMAAGIPVVVANGASLPEVCGEAAVYVIPDDPRDIARGIDKLLSNQQLRKKKALEGRKRAGMFTWQKAAGQVLSILTNK